MAAWPVIRCAECGEAIAVFEPVVVYGNQTYHLHCPYRKDDPYAKPA